MSNDQRRNDDDLAYGGDYGSNKGYYDTQAGQQDDRGIIGDTFRKFKSKYDQRQGNRPPQDYGYGNNSSSTVGSQQYGGSTYGSNNQQQYNQQYNQPSQSGQSAYTGGPQQPPQTKPGIPNQILGGLLGSITSIGHDVEKITGIGSHGPRPPQGQQQAYQQGWQPGVQSNVQIQAPSGTSRERYDSTFPGPRPGNDVKWYVDGCSYMWAVSQALENARQSIWILDWWLSPELYLRRPPAAHEEWRIDRVLQRAANRGVKINIIVYKEVTQALTLSSSHTKHALEALSPNIGVFRHPDHLPDAQTAQSSFLSAFQGLKLDAAGASRLGADALKGIYGFNDDVILYWAHHEKLCLIDGDVAFMGGLDLCFGRWDTWQHPIADAHPSDLNKIVFPGQDYNNARVMDFSEVDHPFQNKLDRTKSSRMGWSDISICLRGACVGDLMHHFVDRWNFIYDEKYNVRSDKRYQRLPPFPDHRVNEGPSAVPNMSQQNTSQVSGQQSQQSGAFAAGYVPPPWQAPVHQPTTPSTNIQGTQGAQTAYGQQALGQQGMNPSAQGQYGLPQQQNYPPPPPIIQPGQNQNPYSQQAPAYSPASQPGQGYSQYSSGQEQTTYPPPLSGHQEAQTQYDPSYYTQSTPAADLQSGQYGGSHHQSQQPEYPSSTQSSLPASGVYDSSQQISNYSAAPSGPGFGTQTGQGSYETGHQQSYYPPPPASPQPAAGQYQPQHAQTDYSQAAHTPNTQETQMLAHQYQAYGASHAAGQPITSNPVELGGAQSSQYQPYSGNPATRGFDGVEEDEPGYSGQRGFDDSYEEGGDRGYGRPPGTSSGRFDRYKDEARRLRTEGKLLGNDLGRMGHEIENRVGGRTGRPQSRGGGPMSCQLVRSCTKWSNGTPTEHSVQNAYIDLIQNAKHFIYIENQFFITATGDKQSPVKNLIGKALVERIIRAARNQEQFKIMVNIPSVPAFAGDLVDSQSLGTRAIMEFQYNSICRGGNSIMEEVAKANINPMDYIRFYNLRNYDRINVTPAQQQAEQSTGIGYDDARKQFESQLGSGYAGYGEMGAQSGQTQGYGVQQGPPQFPPPPQQGQYQQPGQQNQYQQPGPQGSYGYQPPGQSGYGQQQGSQAGYQYQQAAQHAPHVKADQWDTVSSCYMLGGQDIRTVPWSGPPEAELDAFVSEELYIHSKVMIVDDQTVICGSANLNDRSMLGTHDSEIALVINDGTSVQSTMAGRPWRASRFAASLRRQLFRKHLGLLSPQDMQRPDNNFAPIGYPNVYDWGSPEDHIVSDPLADPFQSLWNTRARTNTEIYRKAFRAVPDDNIRSWHEYSQFYEYYFSKADAQAVGKDGNQKASRVEYGHVVRADFPGGASQLKELLSQVKGTVVEMPLCFLQSMFPLSFTHVEKEVDKDGVTWVSLLDVIGMQEGG